MFIAIDEKGNRVEAAVANRDLQYYCPVCGNPVILRSGLQNADHFAHTANECEDRWNYDMSEWHIKMQGYFPVDTREIVIKHNGIVHRADLLIDKTVIEMQHSPISAEEFNDRNEFFRELSYRVVWIFDVRDKVDNGQIQYLDENTITRMKWKHPMRIFDVLDRPLSDYDKSFAIYLHLRDYEEDDMDTCIYRVVWTRGNNDGFVDFSRFAISEEEINIGCIENVNELFTPLRDKRKVIVQKKLNALKKESVEKGFSYSVKYIGQKGKPRSAYTCDRRKKFGVSWSGESACQYCKYCAMIIETEREGKKKCAIYCCYPNEYRAPDKDAHPGYECFRAVCLNL